MAGGQHSGMAGGVAPETFTIARALIDRLDNALTQEVTQDLHVEIPASAVAEAKHIAELQGDELYKPLKFLDGCKAISQDNIPELYLNNNWRPSVSIVGAEGLPVASGAGNVLRDSTKLRLSIRLPPTLDGEKAFDIVNEKLSKDIPFNAKVTVECKGYGNGFAAPDYPEWLKKCLNDASETFFNKPYGSYGIGGSIPFLSQLGAKYPTTHILAAGVIGSDSCPHNPDECLYLPYMKTFIKTLSHVLGSL
jgi:acetylornithine deacetylase/succinyl-diaminopimelate desuccinylase-like protein